MIKKSLALIATSLLWSFSCLYSDTINEFTHKRVRDFHGYDEQYSIEKLKKLFERRKGVYGCDVSSVPFFEYPVRRLLISVESPECVCIVFEDKEGALVSCQELMNGKLSDLSFYWGPDIKGVSAIYGVINDLMLVLFSPHNKQMLFRLDRQTMPVDISAVKLLPSKQVFKGIASQELDVIDLVCQDKNVADKVRRNASIFSSVPGVGEEPVAYYQLDYKSTDYDNMTTLFGGRKWQDLYMMLTAEGGIYLVLADDGKKFNYCMHEQFHDISSWWNMHSGRCRDYGIWAVFHDGIVNFYGPLGISTSIDNSILHPKRYNARIIVGGRTQNEVLKEDMDYVLEKGVDAFRYAKYNRIPMTEETQELRKRIYEAVKFRNFKTCCGVHGQCNTNQNSSVESVSPVK